MNNAAEEILQIEQDNHYGDVADKNKWKIELTITEVDEHFEYRFNISDEISGTETYANYILDKYVKYFESRGGTVGGGLVKVNEEE
jgi:hypothetical protein